MQTQGVGMDPARRALATLLRTTTGRGQFPLTAEHFAARPQDADVMQQLLATHRFVVEIVPRQGHSPRLAITVPGVFALDPVEWAAEQAAIIDQCDTLRELSRTHALKRVNLIRSFTNSADCLGESERRRRITQIVSARLSGQYYDDPTGYQGWGASIGGADPDTGYFSWICLSQSFARDYRPVRTPGPLLPSPQQGDRPVARLQPLTHLSTVAARAILALGRVPGVFVHVVDLQAAAAGLLALPVPEADVSKWPSLNRLEALPRQRLDVLVRRLRLLRELGAAGKAPPRWASRPGRRADDLERDLDSFASIPGDYTLIKHAKRGIERAIKTTLDTPEWAWLTEHVEIGEWCRWVE